MQIYGYLLLLFFFKSKSNNQDYESRNKLLFYTYCPSMSVNDLHWPETKCHITFHLQRADLNVTLPLVSSTLCAQESNSDNSSSRTLMRSGRSSWMSISICSGSRGISNWLDGGGEVAGLGIWIFLAIRHRLLRPYWVIQVRCREIFLIITVYFQWGQGCLMKS